LRCERFERRALRECRRAGDAVVQKKFDRLKCVFGDDTIAKTPARHGVYLGKTVYEENAVENIWYVENARGRIGIINFRIDFVREDQQVVFCREFGNPSQIVQVQYASGWILRRIDDDHFRPGSDAARKFVEIEPEFL